MLVRNIDGDKVMINDPETFLESFEKIIKMTEGKQDKLSEEQKEEIERKMFLYNQIIDNIKEEEETVKRGL